MKLGKTSCCCGATRSNPCACMKKGVMKCSSKEPKCPCYREKDLKKSVEKRRFATYPTCTNPYCVARVDNEGDSCERHQGVTKAFDVAWSVVKGENEPTNPGLWSQAKSKARSKFKVYPSAYANGWAAKWYKSKGGGWKSKSKK